MLTGIDISKWQGNVDFNKVKAYGIKFCIFRSSYGVSTTDPKFYDYVKGAKNANIPIVGIYHFSYATSQAEAIFEAKYCVSVAQKAGLPKDTIIFYDFEYDTVTRAKSKGVSLGSSQCISFTKAFCNTVQSLGYKAGVYANLDYMKNMYKGMNNLPNDITLWIAHYTSQKTTSYPCLFQQYSSSGKVNGIAGNIDMNWYFGDSLSSVKNTTSTTTTTTNNSSSKSKTTTEGGFDMAKLATVKSGSKGNTVKSLQSLLNGKYNQKLAVDGSFGPATLSAVKSYQKAKKLTVDGVCGPKTWETLLTA